MYEEYLNSKEIVQKIADLKIRLALQQEFEQEVDKLVAEVNPTDTGQTRQIREMEDQVLRDIAAHTVRRTQRHEQKRRFPRCARVIAAIALLIMVSVGSAMATVHMVQIGSAETGHPNLSGTHILRACSVPTQQWTCLQNGRVISTLPIFRKALNLIAAILMMQYIWIKTEDVWTFPSQHTAR